GPTAHFFRQTRRFVVLPLHPQLFGAPPWALSRWNFSSSHRAHLAPSRSLSIPSSLFARMRLLGNGEWAFRSRAGTPLNPGNVLKRYVRRMTEIVAAANLALATRCLKKWPTKVVSEILGHSDVHATLRGDQHVETEDFRAPLNELADELLRDVTKSSPANPCGDKGGRGPDLNRGLAVNPK